MFSHPKVNETPPKFKEIGGEYRGVFTLFKETLLKYTEIRD